MIMSNTYFEINLEKEQRLNELKTLYTVDELINHCYEEEQKNKRAIEYIEDNLSGGENEHFHVNFDGNVMQVYMILKEGK